MSSADKKIYGKEVKFYGDSTPVQLSAPGSSLTFAGPINVIDSAAGSDADILIYGNSIADFQGQSVSYGDTATHLISASVNQIKAKHPAADGQMVLSLPEIATLSGPKSYVIDISGDLRYSNAGQEGRQVRIEGYKSGASGDYFDERGAVFSGAWNHNGTSYHSGAKLSITSRVGEYALGSTNGWIITSSHMEDYKYTKQPVRVRTVANMPSFPIGLIVDDTVDGVVLKKHDRILVMEQSNSIENGVYVVQTSTVTRSNDFKAGINVGGFEVRVLEGTHVGEEYYCSTHPSASKAGTNGLAFTQAISPVGGADTQLLYNSSGVESGHADLTFDGVSMTAANPIICPGITSPTAVSILVTGNTVADRDLIVEAQGADAETYLGSATVDSTTRIAQSATTKSLVVCSQQSSGAIVVGAAASRTGNIQFGTSTSNYLFNARSGTMNLETKNGDLGIVSSADLNLTSTAAVTIVGGNSDPISIGTSTLTEGVRLLSTQESTTTGTGCLRVSGGVGVVKSLFVGSRLNMAGKASVTQITSGITGVTVNAPAGKITTFSPLTLLSHAKATFVVTNSSVTATDIVLANVQSYTGAGSLSIMVNNIGAGSFDVTMTNTSGSTLDAGAVIGFLIV